MMIDHDIKLSTVYEHKITKEKIIPYAVAQHFKDGKITETILVLFRNARNPETIYFSMGMKEFVATFENFEL